MFNKFIAMIKTAWVLVAMVITAMVILHAVPVGTLPVSASTAKTVASSGVTSVPELVAPPSCDEYSRDIALRLPAPTSAELLLQIAQEGVTQQTAQYAVDGWRDRGTPGNRVVSPVQTFVTNSWVPRSGSNGLGGSWTPPQLTIGGRSVRFLRLEELLRANPGRWFIRRHDVFYVDVRTGTAPPQSIPGYISVTRTPMARADRHMLTPDTTRYTVDVTTGSGFNAQYVPVNGVTQLAQLFTGVPSFVTPVGTVERVTTWKVYARPGSITVPRIGYQRQVQQACAAVPDVADTINTPSRGQRRLLARLLSRLDHVDEDLGAPADLKPVVSHARDLVMAALERRLDADQTEIDAARAESKAWKAAYLTVVDFVVRLQVGISNTLNTLARTGWVLLVIALLATFVAVRYWRKAGPPPISGDLVRNIKGALLLEIEGDLTFMTHFMKNNRAVVGLNDEDGVYIDALNVHGSIGEQIIDGVSRFFAVYGRVAKLVAKSVPTNKAEDVPAPSSPAVFKDLKGNDHPRTDDDIRAVLEATDAAAFERGKESVVIPTPTFLDCKGEAVTLGNQDHFRAFETKNFAAGAASRDKEVSDLANARQEAEDHVRFLIELLVQAGILDEGIGLVDRKLVRGALKFQIKAAGTAISSNKEEIEALVSARDGALKRAQAAEKDRDDAVKDLYGLIRFLGEQKLITADVALMPFHESCGLIDAQVRALVQAVGSERAFVASIWPVIFDGELPARHVPGPADAAAALQVLRSRRVETGSVPAVTIEEPGESEIVIVVGSSSARVITNDSKQCMELIGSMQTQAFRVPEHLRHAAMPHRLATQMVAAAGVHHAPTSLHIAASPLPSEALGTGEAPAADPNVILTITKKAPTEGQRARRCSLRVAEMLLQSATPAEPVTPADFQSRRVTPLSSPMQAATPTPTDRPSFVGSPLVTGLRAPTPSGVHDVYPPASDPSAASDSTG